MLYIPQKSKILKINEKRKRFYKSDLTGIIVTIINAPSTVILGTPDGNGIPYTMPSLPVGAGSLILEVSPENTTWYQAATGLAGGATGTMALGSMADSPIGYNNTLIYFRAKNTNGGLTGNSTNATTVDLPGIPTEVVINDGGGGGIPDETYLDTDSFPSDTIEAYLYVDIDVSGEQNLGNLPDSPTHNGPYNFTGATSIISFMRAHNIYGSTDSNPAFWP